MNDEDQLTGTPKLAILVSIYHIVIILISCFVMIYAECTIGYLNSHKSLVYVLSFGAIGGALNASRTVVIAVRYGKYDKRRVLWQILTPIHGAILAAVGYVLFQGGIVAFTSGVDNPNTYMYFLMGVSFLIGFSSELFIKRLIKAAESLFGEFKNANQSPL